jgi:eukaryotic-like serine/threonine-protein kinase
VAGTDQQQTAFHFGVFELNSSAGELRKHGVKLKLQDQPLQILATLLENAGQVVTREDIRKRLWLEDTYVDFDNAINSAVRKLRDALGDSPENPRFVETLARRGYRFIAPVSRTAAVASVREEGPSIQRHTLRLALSPTGQKTKKRHMLQAVVLTLAAVALLGIGFQLWSGHARTDRVSRSETASPIPPLRRITSDAGLTTDPAVSRDGSLLAYASDRSSEGYLNIWMQQRSGGEPIRLTHTLADERQPSFSPDGTQVVFRSELGEGSIYVVPSLGGPIRFIAKGGRAPRFSPDGKWIAYWVGMESTARLGVSSGKVYVIPSAGGSAIEVSTGLWVAGAPVWSLDSKYLLVFGEKKPEPHFEEAPDWWVLPAHGGTPVQTGAYRTFAAQGLRLTAVDVTPYPSDWVGDKVLFSANFGDSVDVWGVPIRARDWQITGKATRLTSVAGEAVSASAASDGEVVFSNLSQQTHLWSLPIDVDGIPKHAPKQVTDSAAAEYWPSVSPDGSQLAFTSTRTGKERIWLKNLNTGKESPLPSTGHNQEFPKFSPDGRRIAFTDVEQEAMEKHKATIYIVTLDGMVVQKTTDGGDWVWTWSPDGRYLLCKWGEVRYIKLLDTNSGKWSEFIRDPERDLFQPTFSPDGRWLAFMSMSGLLVAPYRGPQGIAKQDYAQVTSGGIFDDKPRWSANGSILYFTSDRDGSRCLWSQHLDPKTKAPNGAPAPVYHFHSGRRSIGNVGFAFSDITVTRDAIIFAQTELKGNLWTVASRDKPINSF